MTSDPQTTPSYYALDPHLAAAQLQQLAAERPDLWPSILQHPNCYPELAQYIHDHYNAALSAAPEAAATAPQSLASGPHARIPAYVIFASLLACIGCLWLPLTQLGNASIAYLAGPEVAESGGMLLLALLAAGACLTALYLARPHRVVGLIASVASLGVVGFMAWEVWQVWQRLVHLAASPGYGLLLLSVICIIALGGIAAFIGTLLLPRRVATTAVPPGR